MSSAHLRLIYVAPEASAGGVGAYADTMVGAFREFVDDVVEIRHPKPGADTVAQLRERRAAIAEAIGGAGSRRVVLHAELSGGSVESLWPTARLDRLTSRYVTSTATVHDPPNLVWWPLRTRFLAERRLLNHGLHFTTRPVMHQVEKQLGRGREYFALSDIGAESVRQRFPASAVRRTYLPILDVGEAPPAGERPRAVGLFGIVYRGKGFEHVQRIRAMLDDDIDIRIAGRGTEALPPIDGVTVLGTLDDAEVPDFFSSIRVLLMPYGRRSPYGEAFPASAVAAHAITHRTPYICTDHGALGELGAEGGAVVVSGCSDDVAGELAAQAALLVDDAPRLAALDDDLMRMGKERSPGQLAEAMLQVWSR